MSQSKPPHKTPGEETLEELGWGADDVPLDRQLLALQVLAGTEGDLGAWATAAFDAVTMIGQVYEKEHGELPHDPDARLPVPAWGVRVVAQSWSRYRNPRGGLRLDQAFGLTPTRGRAPRHQQLDLLHRDLLLTLTVIHRREKAEREGAPRSLEDIFAEVDADFHLEDVTVKKIYFKYKNEVASRHQKISGD